MRKFYGFEKVRVGNMEAEGTIWLAADGIIAIEGASWSGGQSTDLTLSGGRVVHVRGGEETIRAALAKRRRPERRDSDPMMDFMRDFFALRRRA